MLLKQLGQFKLEFKQMLIILLEFALEIEILFVEPTVDGVRGVASGLLQELTMDGDHGTSGKQFMGDFRQLSQVEPALFKKIRQLCLSALKGP